VPMKLLIKSLTHKFQGTYNIIADRLPDRLTIRCEDSAGNLVAARVLSEGQLRNRQLVMQVMLDLERSLLPVRNHHVTAGHQRQVALANEKPAWEPGSA